jgi:tetratricopeptide (TPR) repeat protein
MRNPFPFLLLAVPIAFGQNTAFTRGGCSPAISQAGGNVTITYQSNSCPELNAATVAELKAFLTKFPKTVDRLNELLDQKDIELADRTKRISEWITKYSELEKRLATQDYDSDLSRRAASKLRENDLEGAGKLLDESISRGESRLDALAQDHFSRGQVFELEFRIDRALEQYQKAYQYRLGEFEYGFEYARLLRRQNRLGEAEPVFRASLQIARRQASERAAFLPDVAKTLNELGSLYSDTQRLKEAETAYKESLATYRELAKENAVAYLPAVTMVLNNVGILYGNTQRLKEAEAAYREGLGIRRELNTTS